MRWLADFFQRADGGIGVTDTGEPWVQVAASANARVLAVLQSHRLVAPVSGGTGTAAYSGIDLGVGNLPYRMVCHFGFSTGISASNAIGLITNPNGLSSVANITNGSIHITFGPTVGTVGYYSSGVLTNISSHPYVLLMDGVTVYEASWILVGTTLTVTYPDGVTTAYTNVNFGTQGGRYCTFEHFTTTDATEARPYFTSVGINWDGSPIGSGVMSSVELPTYTSERDLFMAVISNLHLGEGIVRGDAFSLIRTIPNVPAGDTIASAKLTLKTNITDADPGLFQLTGTVTSAGSTGLGGVTFSFSAANTILMVQDQPYYFDIQITMTGGNILTIEQGITSATYQVTTT